MGVAIQDKEGLYQFRDQERNRSFLAASAAELRIPQKPSSVKKITSGVNDVSPVGHIVTEMV